MFFLLPLDNFICSLQLFLSSEASPLCRCAAMAHPCGHLDDERAKLHVIITKTCLYNVDPLKLHFYIVKLGFTGVYIIFLSFAGKHRLWVLVRTTSPRRLTSTHNLCFDQKSEKWGFYLIFFLVFGGEIFYIFE